MLHMLYMLALYHVCMLALYHVCYACYRSMMIHASLAIYHPTNAAVVHADNVFTLYYMLYISTISCL